MVLVTLHLVAAAVTADAKQPVVQHLHRDVVHLAHHQLELAVRSQVAPDHVVRNPVRVAQAADHKDVVVGDC